MAATEEQKAVLFVLNSLRSSGEDWRRFDHPLAAKAAIGAAEGNFTPISQRGLESYLLHTRNRGRFDCREVIYVRPPAREISAVSALWCRWDFTGVSAKCGFYLGTWWKTRTEPVDAADCETRIVFLGFRYETPEIGDNHNYFHVQPCRSMGAKDKPVVQALPVTEKNPTWPLTASTALELLLCVVMSLYGLRGLAKLQEEIEETPRIRSHGPLLASVKKLRAVGIAR